MRSLRRCATRELLRTGASYNRKNLPTLPPLHRGEEKSGGFFARSGLRMTIEENVRFHKRMLRDK